MASYESRSTAASSQPRPVNALLRLPAELRNRIYEYVLSAEGSLEFENREADFNTKSYFFSAMTGKKEFNQLKFVSRQFYVETNCLEFVHNKLRFVGDKTSYDNGPAKLFNKFLGQCTTSKQAWITDVVLNHHPLSGTLQHILEYHDQIARVAKHCRKYPQLKVTYVCHNFDVPYSASCGAIGFMTCGAYLSVAVRNMDVAFLLPTVNQGHLLAVRRGQIQRAGNPRKLRVANLRFWPAEDVTVAMLEEKLRKEAQKGWGLTNAMVEACIEYAADWIANGI
jgi:hypothetical protein